MPRRSLPIVLLWLWFSHLTAAPLAVSDIPDALKPWREWVLWQDQTHACPILAIDQNPRACIWPTSLQLDLTVQGGSFTLKVKSFADIATVLPGDEAHWPQDVTVDGEPFPVMGIEGRPTAFLPPGAHNIAGRFLWERPPSVLTVPNHIALIELTVNHQLVPWPTLNEHGQLWLAEDSTGPTASSNANTEQLKVYRRINDDVPVQVTTRLDLDISGNRRELNLKGVVLDGAIPMQLDSSLPARLEPDGMLRLQVRPGHWSVTVQSRFPDDRTEIALPAYPTPWPDGEIWSFQANLAIRLVEVAGAPSLDPRQTELPEDWKTLPAYGLKTGDALSFQVIRRGDPKPEPDQLTLHRRLWLDFDGGGYTVHDRIGGRMTRDWRLTSGEGMTLGRISINEEPQSITLDTTTQGVGVEVRRGQLNLSGDSRVDSRSRLSATGWAKDFQSVSAELNLPPGWQLIAALGVDEASGAWIDRWTLLDFFVVLTLTLAVGRLWDRRAAALTLITLGLLWQEPEAPRYVWLHLLASTALLRVVPASASTASRAVVWIKGYRLFALVALALTALPFMFQQLQLGLYPQLQSPRPIYSVPAYQDHRFPVPESEPMADLAMAEKSDEAVTSADAEPPRPMLNKRGPRLPAAQPVVPAPTVYKIDPKAITQTGPGLPDWEWQRLSLIWRGPVTQAQTLTLLLISPGVTLMLNVLRVLLLMWLAGWLIADNHRGVGPGLLRPGSMKAFWLTLLALVLPRAEATELPTPELLNELRARLLAPASCQPHCVDIPELRLQTSPNRLQLEMTINTGVDAGVALPAQGGQWWPSQVTVDGKAAQALFRGDEGQLWLAIPTGTHRVALSGPLPSRDQIELPLPLKPHRVDAGGTAWGVEGIGENGVPEPQLRLIRNGPQAGDDSQFPAGSRPLPGFVEVERTIRLGLDWRICTRLKRLTPADQPLSLEIPLLEGESVLADTLAVRDGKVTVSLPIGQAEAGWESTLAQTATIHLRAPETRQWTEIWHLDVNPIWHIQPSGIAVVHHQSPNGLWQPEWRPWPGESVTLAVTRPSGVSGNTLTLESSDLTQRPGERATASTLTLKLRSSQGGQQTLTLPDGAMLQSVTLDGVAQPIRQEGSAVVLPVHPGTQVASLQWNTEGGIGALYRTPEILLGAASVNAKTHIELGSNRWVLLLGGPAMGPAVLFWGLLATLLLIAFGLRRIPHSPASYWQWALLLVGLSQASLLGGAMVVGWLLLLAWRGQHGTSLSGRGFRAIQITLALLTLVALAILASAVAAGLLGMPAMQIAGYGSDAWHLNWYQDRTADALPRPWVVSVHLWVYRILMLAWALWLANTLLNWLRWGWACFTAGGIWTNPPAPPQTAPVEEKSTDALRE